MVASLRPKSRIVWLAQSAIDSTLSQSVPSKSNTHALKLIIFLLCRLLQINPLFQELLIKAGRRKATGGYLVGYIFLALIAGAFVGRFAENKWKNIAFAAIGMILGTIVLYLVGTAWLAYSAGMEFRAALWAGVIPFIPGDLVKMVIAVLLGSAVRARLLRAGILR